LPTLPLEPCTHPLFALVIFQVRASSFSLRPVTIFPISGLPSSSDYRCVWLCPALMVVLILNILTILSKPIPSPQMSCSRGYSSRKGRVHIPYTATKCKWALNLKLEGAFLDHDLLHSLVGTLSTYLTSFVKWENGLAGQSRQRGIKLHKKI
jgi:hypothetical protein